MSFFLPHYKNEMHLLVFGNKSDEEKFSRHPTAQSSALGLMPRTFFPGVGHSGSVWFRLVEVTVLVRWRLCE